MFVEITYADGTCRRIGRLEGDTLVCRRDVAKHLFRFGRATVEEARRDGVSAWGLDCDVCDGLCERGATWLLIKVGKVILRCSLQDMQKKGSVLHIKPHRAQYFLNEQFFERMN